MTTFFIFTLKIEASWAKKVVNSILKIWKVNDVIVYGGDYMIPVCRDESSTRPAGAYFTLQLHAEIKFHHGKAGQFSTCYLFRFAGTFLESFL